MEVVPMVAIVVAHMPAIPIGDANMLAVVLTALPRLAAIVFPILAGIAAMLSPILTRIAPVFLPVFPDITPVFAPIFGLLMPPAFTLVMLRLAIVSPGTLMMRRSPLMMLRFRSMVAARFMMAPRTMTFGVVRSRAVTLRMAARMPA
jgi:hypothetical protein